MNYLEALKFENIPLEGTAKTAKSPLRGFCSATEEHIQKKNVEIFEGGLASTDVQPSEMSPQNCGVESDPHTPAPCTNCPRLKAVEIQGEQVLGCLYPATGEFSEGWKRLPADIKRCLWN